MVSLACMRTAIHAKSSLDGSSTFRTCSLSMFDNTWQALAETRKGTLTFYVTDSAAKLPAGGAAECAGTGAVLLDG